jgi:hypothetical protein
MDPVMTAWVIMLVGACVLTYLLFPLMAITSFADRGRRKLALVAGVAGYSLPFAVALFGAFRQAEGFWPVLLGGLVWPAVGVNLILVVLARAVGRSRSQR